MDVCRCSCGASGDVGEITEHQVSRLTDPDNRGDHGLTTGTESDRVTQLRQTQMSARQTAELVADQLGLTIDELRQTFGNLR